MFKDEEMTENQRINLKIFLASLSMNAEPLFMSGNPLDKAAYLTVQESLSSIALRNKFEEYENAIDNQEEQLGCSLLVVSVQTLWRCINGREQFYKNLLIYEDDQLDLERIRNSFSRVFRRLGLVRTLGLVGSDIREISCFKPEAGDETLEYWIFEYGN